MLTFTPESKTTPKSRTPDAIELKEVHPALAAMMALMKYEDSRIQLKHESKSRVSPTR